MRQLRSHSLRPARRNRGMFFFLLAVSISYWYCLPVMSQSLITYSEFRAYDVLLVILGVILLFNYRKLRTFFNQDKPGQAMLYFCLWATASFPLTIIWVIRAHRPDWILVTCIFLFHLWGFFLFYAAVRIYIKTRAECQIILDVFLVIGGIESLIICLQGLHIIPRFWSSLYDAYGDVATATLGPNRAMPGHALVLVFMVAVAYWRNQPVVGIKRVAIAAIVALLAVIASAITGSRTTALVLIVFLICSLFWRGINLRVVGFSVLLVVGFALFVPGSLKVRLTETYEYRVSSRLKKVQGRGTLDEFQAIDAGRYRDWVGTLQTLPRVPWVVPFGAGFNSFRFVISPYGLVEDTSAHNIYLTLICEVGLLGLFLYLLWFWRIWRETSALTAFCVQNKKKRRMFLPLEVKPLLIGMAVSLSAGEILLTYRPAFSFMGMFLMVCGVFNHRAFVTGVAREGQLVSQRAASRRLKDRRTAYTSRRLIRQQAIFGQQSRGRLTDAPCQPLNTNP